MEWEESIVYTEVGIRAPINIIGKNWVIRPRKRGRDCPEIRENVKTGNPDTCKCMWTPNLDKWEGLCPTIKGIYENPQENPKKEIDSFPDSTAAYPPRLAAVESKDHSSTEGPPHNWIDNTMYMISQR